MPRAHESQDADAVEVGQHPVEDDDVEWAARQQRHRGHPIRREVHDVPFRHQDAADELRHLGLVLDDQHVHVPHSGH